MTHSEEKTIDVFIVAGSPMARAGLKALLETSEGFAVTGEAAEISAASLNFSVGQTAEVLLVNAETVRDFDDLIGFLSDSPEDVNLASVVALFSPELLDSNDVVRALQSGIRGILPHDASASEITGATGAAARGLVACLPETLESVLYLQTTENQFDSAIAGNKEQLPDEPPGDSVERLTARETEILELLADGASNKSIAYQLNISEHTVKFHVASIFGKLGVGTRTEAAMRGIKRGLILL